MSGTVNIHKTWSLPNIMTVLFPMRTERPNLMTSGDQLLSLAG